MIQLVEYTLAGWELELYSPSEWPFLYWYAVGLLENQLSTVEELQLGSEANIWLGNYADWCQALKDICSARLLVS